MMKRILPLCLLLSLIVSACVAPPKGRRPPSIRPAAENSDASKRLCLADLDRLGARYSSIPDQNFGGGCSTVGSVALATTPIPISSVKAIRCPLARALAVWLRDDAQPAAKRYFGSPIVKVESYGAYACRNIIGGNTSLRSEHATANAVDIGGFVLRDGRRVMVKSGWQGDSNEQRFWRSVRAAGCQRFQTVLSPDYNAAHHDHLHFDMGRGPFCR